MNNYCTYNWSKPKIPPVSWTYNYVQYFFKKTKLGWLYNMHNSNLTYSWPCVLYVKVYVLPFHCSVEVEFLDINGHEFDPGGGYHTVEEEIYCDQVNQ